MNKKLAHGLTSAVLALALLSSSAAASDAPPSDFSASAPTHTAALVPFAMQVFCTRNPAQCATSDSASQIAANTDLMAVLQQVNRRVNEAIAPRRDVSDNWQANTRYGDCEDYVLTKRAQLIGKGVPAGSLRVAFTQSRQGEAHAVLVVKTSSGDYVLDNLTNKVTTLRASGYTIRTMSSADPTRWING